MGASEEKPSPKRYQLRGVKYCLRGLQGCSGNVWHRRGGEHLWTAIILLRLCVHCKRGCAEPGDLRRRQKTDHSQPCLHFFFFLFLLGPHPRHIESSQEGSNQSYSCRSMPQPQPRQIQAMSATHTAALGNPRSLTP